MKKLISIAVPVHNEEENIPLLYAELIAIADGALFDVEIIFVDDGSTDGSWKAVSVLASKDRRVKGVSFSRNFGHQAAMEAGISIAGGDAIITMDGDLQHPPHLINDLVQKWGEGYDIVNTKRLQTEREGLGKRITSKMFYAFINKISDIHIEEGSADFRLMDRKVVDQLKNLPEKDKFYRGLVNWIGFRSTSIDYTAAQRIHGNTSYTWKKMLNFGRIGITSFSMLPMKMIFVLGSFLFLGGSLALAIMLYVKYIVDSNYFSGTAVLVMIILANNGIIIMAIGIISIYSMTMFKELKNRPNFIICDKVNW